MQFNPQPEITLENFDQCWGLGEPAVVEQKFRELSLQAQMLADKSIYIQILSQIALAQALQKQFGPAHDTLAEGQKLLTPANELAHVRLLFEHGRVHQQAGDIAKAKTYFEQAYELSKIHNFDFHTINAAHMMAASSQTAQEKIKWNTSALELAQVTSDTRVHEWLGALWNTLGQNYLEDQQLDKALEAFEKSLEFRKKEGFAPNIRMSRWSVARALRALDRANEALAIQHELFEEFNAIARSGQSDVPVDVFKLTRGFVFEEIAEIYHSKSKLFAKLAQEDLSSVEMFQKTATTRLERLKTLSTIE